MYKINLYLFFLSIKYILLNLIIITFFVAFLNLIEISRILEKDSQNLYYYIITSILKLPSIINESIPFVIVIGITFLFRYLINNNELISMRNIGYSIFDIFKPIAFCVLFFGIFILIFINPLSANFELKYESMLKKKIDNMYSIKISENDMWIKNKISEKASNYIKIKNIDLNTIDAKDIKILTINENETKLILAEKGIINNQNFNLINVKLYNLSNDLFKKIKTYKLRLNFTKENVLSSILNFKYVPFFDYFKHIKTLQKFNLYSSEISLFYVSEILKPFFLVILAFVVTGFSGKFKRNDNFFRILFIAILIGFFVFFLKEIITKLTISLNINVMISYTSIFLIPFLIGLYQVIKIEND